MDADTPHGPDVDRGYAIAARGSLQVNVLVAGDGVEQMWEASSWTDTPDAGAAASRLASDVGVVLARWQDWSDAAHGFNLGIVADVPGAAMESTVSGRYTASLARILAWAVTDPAAPDNHRSVPDTVPQVRAAVVLTDPTVSPAPQEPSVEPPREPERPAVDGDVHPDGRTAVVGAGEGAGLVSLGRCVPWVTRLVGLSGRHGVRLLVVITESRHDLDDAATYSLLTLHLYGCGVLVIYLDTVTGESGGEPVTGSVSLTLDPAEPLPADTIALAVLDALRCANPERAL